MSDIHLNRELLQAVADGKIPLDFLARIGLDHLLQLCPHCREEFAAWEEERTAEGDGIALEVLPLLLAHKAREGAQQLRTAERDFRALLALGRAERLARIRRARSRFRGPTLAGLLLAKAEGHMPAEPEVLFELAETAYAVLLATKDERGVDEPIARAMALMANGLRASGDLPGAERQMGTAREIVRRHAVTDPAVCAEIDWLEGLLRKDQGRLREGEEVLVRSVALYGVARDRIGAARSLISLGLLYHERSELARAADVTRAALGHLDSDRHLRLWLCAKHNLALFLCDAGRPDEAAEALEMEDSLYERFPDAWTRLRRTWLEGKIAAGLGRLEEAERALRTVREGFEQQGHGPNAERVELELARVQGNR